MSHPVAALSPERQVLAMYQQVDDKLTADGDTMEVIATDDDLLAPAPDKKIKKEDTLG